MRLFAAISGMVLILAGGGYVINDHPQSLSVGNRVQLDNDSTNSVGNHASPQTSNDDIPSLPARIDFASQVHPLLTQHCGDCHGAARQAAGIDFSGHPDRWNADTVRSLNDVVDATHRTLPRLLQSTDAAAHHQLPSAERNLLLTWLKEGAYAPELAPMSKADFSRTEQEHWAFLSLRRPEVPQIAKLPASGNPIDAFLLKTLQKTDESPAPIADPATKLRRVTFAVTGLPPLMPEAAEAVLARSSSQKSDKRTWAESVDELLDRPEYGEHLARFWLDLVRYADTNGYEDDGQKPFVWKYRDFVIQSLNRDLPYDDFVRFQLAGDLLAETMEPGSETARDAFVASGFLRLGPWDSEPDDALRAHYDQVDDLVSTTGLVFCGLSFGCARCHDHPLEPLSCQDYTRLAACFHGLARPVSGRMEESLPAATPSQLQQAEVVQQQLTRLQRQALHTDDSHQAAELRSQARQLESKLRFEHIYRFAETQFSHQPARLLRRGNPQQPAEYVPAGIPAIMNSTSSPEFPPDDQSSRLQLAEWLTTEGHPLLARVIVNRVWQWHFQQGLCGSSSNLGLSGQRPSHPELLEWLAHWFVHDAKWSLKKLNRLILTSEAFQRQTEPDSSTAERRRSLFAAFNPRPLRAEMLHDAMLQIAGLRSHEMHGPPGDAPESIFEPDRVSDSHGRDQLQPNSNLNQGASNFYRRAVYCLVRRNRPNPLLQAFGFPDSSVSCNQRTKHFSAQQTHVLWNSRRAEVCANGVAQRVVQLTAGDASIQEQASFAFQLILNRTPDRSEQQAIDQFVCSEASVDVANSQLILQELALVLFNSDEFVILK